MIDLKFIECDVAAQEMLANTTKSARSCADLTTSFVGVSVNFAVAIAIIVACPFVNPMLICNSKRPSHSGAMIKQPKWDGLPVKMNRCNSQAERDEGVFVCIDSLFSLVQQVNYSITSTFNATLASCSIDKAEVPATVMIKSLCRNRMRLGY